jgi:hypothetical protein
MKRNSIKIEENPFWIYYIAEDKNFNRHKVGKWMYFFDDVDFAEKICREAVEQRVVAVSKHSNAENGVCCFYLHFDDNEAHKRILQFFLDNKLIQRTKTGRLYNISFKLDDQTRAGEYGENFSSKIKLENFLNLDTGEWLV